MKHGETDAKRKSQGGAAITKHVCAYCSRVRNLALKWNA